MNSSRISVKRTVYVEEETGNICQCSGDFYKTCPLRASANLDCREAIVSITYIDRDPQVASLPESVQSLDKALEDLVDPLKDLVSKIKK